MTLNQQILLLKKLSNKKVILEDEDTIFKPTHLTDNRQEKYKQKIFRLLQQEVVEDDLNLRNLDFITDLGNVKLVKGYLNLQNTPITSLPEGLEVEGNLWLSNTPITSLPEGLVVKGYLWLNNTPISRNLELLKKYKKLYKI